MSLVVLGWGKGGVGNSTISTLLAARGYGVDVQDDYLFSKDVKVRIVIFRNLFELESYKLMCKNDSGFVKADNVFYVINNCSLEEKEVLENKMNALGITVSAYLPRRWYLDGLSKDKGMGLALSKAEVVTFIDDLVLSVGGDHFSLP